MAITEESRFHLHQRLETVLGKEDATTLMEHLPPVGWADVATKADIEQLRVADIGPLRTEVGRLRQDMNRDFAAVRSELETGLARQTDAVRTATSELRTQVAESLLATERGLREFAESLQDMERRIGTYRTQGMALEIGLGLIIAIIVIVTR